MKYDIVFLSRIIPTKIDAEVRSKMIGMMEDAAIAWQEHIIKGIEMANGNPVKQINYLPVNSYPGTYKDAFVKRLEYSHADGAKDISLGYCNVKFIKRFVQWIPLHKELKKWLNQDNGLQKVLIAYTMYPEFLDAIKYVKEQNSNVITTNIVVDMPQYTVLSKQKNSFFNSVYSKWSYKKADNSLKHIDGFVTITQQMANILAKKSQFRVVEGICTTEYPNRKKTNENVKTIVYAGMLHEKFGILTLLQAFCLLKDQGVRLIICGMGEAQKNVEALAQKDVRVVFKGKLHRKEVLELIANADAVVNPRQNNGEYTKYSFPSKNLEALSSGVPFIGYKLDGIPDEYDKYINYPSDETPKALAEIIERVLRDEAYMKKAIQAKEWVSKEKNCFAQGKKIIGMIDSIRMQREEE